MSKKIIYALLGAMCIFSLTACGKDEKSNQAPQETVDLSDEPEKIGETEIPKYPPQEHESEVWESKLGYTMTYNPMIFSVDDTGETDSFHYMTAESLGAPVYVSVQKYDDMDAQTLAEGLALQSGSDEVKIEDTFFGADGMETKCVVVPSEAEGVERQQVFYAIPLEQGTLLVEIGGYIGAPETTEAALEGFKRKVTPFLTAFLDYHYQLLHQN